MQDPLPQARSPAVKTETYNQSTAMKEAIVLYPAPGIGHLVSMVELGKLISNHYTHKFSVIILLTTGPFDTAATAAHIHRISQANPSITFRRFPFISVDTSPTRSEAAIHFEFIRLNATSVRHALEEISRTSSIRSIIIDFFCSSALPIARNLQIPVYYFFTSGAAALAFYLYFPTLDKQISNSFKDLTATYLQFPGFPPIRASHVPEPLLDRVDPAYANMLYFCQHLAKSDGIIVNTFDALEPLAIETIASGACVPDGKTPPIYYIGPLIANPDEGDGNGGGGGGGTAKQDCLSWLDAQPRRSVVYLCFGSRGIFTMAQLKEIANGLKRSGQRFLWVVKPPKQIEAAAAVDVRLGDLLPEGFLERTKEKGMVVKSWAPQVEVLRHESVGGFVTHCGWNSVLEAVVAGVPMVAWPLYAEQHVNRAVLVEKMKMAIPLEEREEDRFVTGIELEKRVRELMESETGRELRERSWKMREMAIAAMGNSGSSTTALANLVELWKQG